MGKQLQTVFGINPEKAFTSTTLTLPANVSKTIGLGAYTRNEPEPQFELCFEPDTGYVASSLDYMSVAAGQQSRIIWFCHLDNYGDEECTVTITRRQD
jgi:hypothetical protein